MEGIEDISSSSFGGRDSEVILCARAGTMLMGPLPFLSRKRRADTSHVGMTFLENKVDGERS